MLAAADPAAQLVQLGDAVALGALDHHHRRVGDVDPDLDHGRRDQHVGRAGGEGLHRRRLLRRGHLAVEDADAEVAQLGRREPLRLSLGGLALHLLGLRDQRADDEGLPALAQPPADELVGGRRARPRRRRRVCDRLAAGGQLAQRGRVEVAVGGQRERARDRRRGHVEDVRRHPLRLPCASSARALLDPEAMLLVDHAEAEPGELDRRLDQRVGADDQAQLAAGERVQRTACASRRRRRPGEQARTGSALPPSSLPRVAACCSASVSVGAISTAWRPASSARSIA